MYKRAIFNTNIAVFTGKIDGIRDGKMTIKKHLQKLVSA
jgi:hypothetical protein